MLSEILSKLSYIGYLPKIALFYRVITLIGMAAYDPLVFGAAFLIDLLAFISGYL